MALPGDEQGMSKHRASVFTRVTILCGAAMLMAAGCGPSSETDAGAPADAGADAAPVTPCAADSECADGTFCSDWRCSPGGAGADARGCIDRGAPCSATETCDEAADMCVAADCTVPDRDGDGHDAIACGGGDCDDEDANRNPGAAEVCDAAGVDEDCRPETLGDTDADGDGHISAECCNGAMCGADCNDDDALVNPAVGEVCNGVDSDCSGAVDDELPDAPLCPGGTCSAARCSFTRFDRVFGGDGFNFAGALDTDARGNLYVGGIFQPGSDFGGGP